MQTVPRLLPFLILLLAGSSLAAQYRTEMRTADKQLELNAYHLAIESYQRALASRPDDPDAQAKVGMAYRMVNEMDSARYYYEQAMDDGRVVPATLLGYAQTLTALGEYALAEPLFATYGREADATVGQHYAQSAAFAAGQRNQDAGFAVDRLAVNSVAPDFGPSVPQPGRLVFNSSRADADVVGTASNRPYVATLADDGSATDPVAVSFSYRVENGYVGPVSYSPDGRTVIFSRNNFTPGTRMVPEAGITLSLLIADVNSEGRWTNVRPLPFNGNTFSSGFGTFGADNETIYFSSDRPGGFGGWDVYRATFDGQRWSEVPENVGRTVNSQGHEITPYFDGNSLFFSSNWHPGLGGYDVFRAELEGLRPVNLYHMGAAVNSSRDDFGFVYDPASQTGYVTSNRPTGRPTQEDIYYVRPKAGAPAPTVAGEGAGGLAPEASVPAGVSGNDPVPFGAVRGYVATVEGNRPVEGATVRITNRTTGGTANARTDVNGAYYASLEPYTTYDIAVNADGFEPVTFPITSDGGTKQDLLGSIRLLPAAPAPEPAAEESESPTTYDRPVTVDARAPEGGFALQIASLAAAPPPERFAALAPLGTVYTVEEGGRTKVRLGGFATRAQAEAIISNVTNLGFPGSFPVAESGEARDPIVASEAPVPAPAPTVADATPARSPYRVQLGAFGKPENFDRARAATLGALNTEMRGALTVFFIEGLPTAEAATEVRERALSMGYAGAYILELTENGYRKP
ncbi:carboxypeptidase regulatory-like domain-containing protein [Lewinella sp. IMCC34183]|uniref:carboxypeptidase regulatory-like domain-containing protein n=1 Tax=Lewinella sp. IMCC34183 TaxID=2248762 RepID=UPI000E222D9B|nr:carboxypeptidase regulatory-like domain-containing protein [Lewinella sp. IMCC34183]